jgi:hypothetical protein
VSICIRFDTVNWRFPKIHRHVVAYFKALFTWNLIALKIIHLSVTILTNNQKSRHSLLQNNFTFLFSKLRYFSFCHFFSCIRRKQQKSKLFCATLQIYFYFQKTTKFSTISAFKRAQNLQKRSTDYLTAVEQKIFTHSRLSKGPSF